MTTTSTRMARTVALFRTQRSRPSSSSASQSSPLLRQKYVRINATTTMTQTEERLEQNTNRKKKLDAIIVVAGGFTADNKWLPIWVLERLDYCAKRYKEEEDDDNNRPYITIAGSATPHKEPPLQKGGFVYHESTMMAEYLIDEHDIDPRKILKDTASMDTIGNAYFTRYVHAVPRGWKNVEVVTSNFHMRRVKAAFEWVWGMPITIENNSYDNNNNNNNNNNNSSTSSTLTEITFVSTKDVGLSEQTLLAREQREIESERALLENAKKYDTSEKFAEWMFTTHKCYAVSRQDEIGDFEAVRKELGEKAEALGY